MRTGIRTKSIFSKFGYNNRILQFAEDKKKEDSEQDFSVLLNKEMGKVGNN